MTESLFRIVDSQLFKIFGDRYIEDRLAIWDKFFSLHGEILNAGTLDQCLDRVYTKSGAETLQEFWDYIEIQATFL